jgi:Gly-Xaa carboxypeptidase
MAIETMLIHGVQPRRSVVLAFGFDEEISGSEGAGKLAPYLEYHYGTNGFSLLIDEGGRMEEVFGAIFAAPAIGEKGYIDTRIEVTTPGGHSSIPPASRHTVSNFVRGLGSLLTLPVRESAFFRRSL